MQALLKLWQAAEQHTCLQICRIENIVGKGRDAAMRVKWFYRPEETCSGRRVRLPSRCNQSPCSCGFKSAVCDSQAFHSENEVMASDHVETHLQPAASIVSKCRIHTLEQYMVSSGCSTLPIVSMVLQRMSGILSMLSALQELEKKTSKDLYSRFTYLVNIYNLFMHC